MELKEIYQGNSYINGVLSNSSKISFEVFPPKDNDFSNLFEQVRILKRYNPVLVSLTYGANGGTRDLSLDLLRNFLDLELNVMPHLTCVGATRELIEHYIVQIENMGIENILALRGDLPNESLSSRDFEFANELVEYIQQKSSLSIGVAGYPECHFECDNQDKDIENLKRKVDAGASAIYTQLFFNNDKYYSYLEKLDKAGINLPVIPGIMPIKSLKQIEKMVEITHVQIPDSLRSNLEKYPTEARKIGIEYTISQCKNLIEYGVCGLHFFTLNKAENVSEILDNIL